MTMVPGHGSAGRRIDHFDARFRSIGVRARIGGFRSRSGAPIVARAVLGGSFRSPRHVGRPLPALISRPGSVGFTELVATSITNPRPRRECAAGRGAGGVAAGRDAGGPRGGAGGGVHGGHRGGRAAASASTARHEPLRARRRGRPSSRPRAAAGAASPLAAGGSLRGTTSATLVFETGRPARIELCRCASGPIGVAARERGRPLGGRAPIIVEGRVWA